MVVLCYKHCKVVEIRENTLIHVENKVLEKNLSDNFRLPIYMFLAASYSVYWCGRAGLDCVGDVVTETQ
jgi:hypothetical protein